MLFDAPPSILSGMQSFYENAGALLGNETAHQEFRSLTSSNAYSRTQFTEEFDRVVKIAETDLLPALQEAAERANALVRDYMD